MDEMKHSWLGPDAKGRYRDWNGRFITKFHAEHYSLISITREALRVLENNPKVRDGWRKERAERCHTLG